MVLLSTTTVALIIALLVVAALTAVVSVAVIGRFVATNRRARLDRHESIGTYYRDLVASH